MVDCAPEVFEPLARGGLREDGIDLAIEHGSHGTGVDVEVVNVLDLELVVFI